MAEMLQNDLRPWWQELPKCWEGSRKAKSMCTMGAWLLNDPVPKFSCVSKRKWSFKLKSKCFVLSRKWWLFSWRKTVPSNHCHGSQKWHHTVLWRLLFSYQLWSGNISHDGLPLLSRQINRGQTCDITSHHEAQASKESGKTSHLEWKYFGFKSSKFHILFFFFPSKRVDRTVFTRSVTGIQTGCLVLPAGFWTASPTNVTTDMLSVIGK